MKWLKWKLWEAGALRRRLVQRATIWIAWHLPKSLVMWCWYRVAAHATQGQWGHESPCDVKMMDAIQRWGVK